MKRIETWQRLACAALYCGICAALAACSNSKKEIGTESLKQNMNTDAHVTTQCVGRFLFNIPDVLAPAGRSQSIYRVEVSTVPLPPGGADALWQNRLTRIQAMSPPSGVANVVIRSIELSPGVRGIWYFGNPDFPGLHNLDAMKPQHDHVVWAARSGEAGKEGNVETLVRNVLDAYAPGLQQGFCVGYGSVTSEPGLNENSNISFEHKQVAKFELRVATQTVNEPDTRTYSSVDEEKQVIEGLHGNMTVLRDHDVSVANLKGKEIWISGMSPKDPPFVRFTWHFPGVGGDSFHPMINVVATAPKEQQSQLETIWDTLLKSLQQVPAAAR